MEQTHEHPRRPGTGLAHCPPLPFLGPFLVLLLPPAAAAAPPPPSVLESPTYPLRVEYPTEDLAPLARRVLAAAEQAWVRQVLELGYPAPYRGGRGEPVEHGMNLLLVDTGMGSSTALAGWVSDVEETPLCDCSGAIAIDSATPADSPHLDETVFHELNHTTQYAADCTEPPSAYEGFAIAAVHLEFPQSTIVPWVIGQFQAFPEQSLDLWTMEMPCTGERPCFPYQLGAALFPLYLLDRFADSDPRVLPQLFASFAQEGTTRVGPPHPTCNAPNRPDWFEGVASFVEAHGSTFAEAFSEFAAWRAIVGEHDDGRHFARGAEYAEPAIAARHLLNGREPVSGQFEVHEYGTRYIEGSPAEEGPRGPWIVTVTGAPEAGWSGSVLLWRAGEAVERVPLVFESEVGQATVASLEGMERLLLVVSQLQDDSHAPDELDYQSTRSFSYRLTPEGGDGADAGSDPGADGGNDPADLAGDAAVEQQDGTMKEDLTGAPSGVETPGCSGCALGPLSTSSRTGPPLTAAVFLLLLLVRRRTSRRADPPSAHRLAGP